MRNFLIELKWGVGFFLSGLLWVSLEKSLGWHDRLLEQHATYTLFYAPIAILIYVLALRDKRKNSYLGTMNYVQGFVSGLVVTLIVVLLTPVSQYITYELISPAYFSNSIDLSVEKKWRSLAEAQEYFSLKNHITQNLLFATAMGVMTSAVVALFLRSKT